MLYELMGKMLYELMVMVVVRVRGEGQNGHDLGVVVVDKEVEVVVGGGETLEKDGL